jgi:hypothetical protein
MYLSLSRCMHIYIYIYICMYEFGYEKNVGNYTEPASLRWASDNDNLCIHVCV